MNNHLIGIIEFVLGGLFHAWWTNRHPSLKQASVFRAEVDRLELLLKKYRSRYNKEATGDDKLCMLTAMDAIKREQRAKAALVGVLKESGCNEEQIDQVLLSVDNEEEGDGKKT